MQQSPARMSLERWFEWLKELGYSDEQAIRGSRAAFQADSKGMAMVRAADIGLAHAKGEADGPVDYAWWEKLLRDKAFFSVIIGAVLCYGALAILSPTIVLIGIAALVNALRSARTSWRGFVSVAVVLNAAAIGLEFVPGIHNAFLLVAP